MLDSGSTDRTCEIAVARAPRVRLAALDVPFSFGRALNRGCAQLHGDLFVFLSGHAVPRDERWLEHLLAPLSDPRVAGVYGRQVPHPDCVPWEADAIRRAYGPTPRLQHDDPFFSNANAAIRRSAWCAHPFDESLTGAEDQHFAARVQARGGLVAYAPEAAAYHSHNETIREVTIRAEREARALAAIDLLHWPGLPRAMAGAVRNGALTTALMLRDGPRRPRQLVGPAGYHAALFLGRWRATRSGP